MGAINHNFTRMFEVHRDSITYNGLDLAQPPFLFYRMANQISRFEKVLQQTITYMETPT